MKSMTGYGTSQLSSKDLDLELAVKSVNGRFLECRVHLPREYAPFEIDIKKKVSEIFRRGTVDIYVNRRLVDPSAQMGVVVNTNMAKKWLKAYRELAKELKIKEDFHLSDLASLPQVMSVKEFHGLWPAEKKQLFQLLSRSLRLCEQERKREGRALKKELLSLLKELEKMVRHMQVQTGSQGDKLKKRLEHRLSLSGLESRTDPQRLAQEIALQLDRSDITEELVRLREHIAHLTKMVNAVSVQGKKLDFYTQELLREVNTIGSKSQAAQLTETVVNAKALVEKVREQVQNIE
jgi:uncharacterized protein (TIGR00255 family)